TRADTGRRPRRRFALEGEGVRGAAARRSYSNGRNRKKMKVLVTGAAGFIGSTLTHRLLDRGDRVVGIDNLNDYYDVRLKQARLDRLNAQQGFQFERLDIVESKRMAELFSAGKFDSVVHLAAQAGVRYSLTNPAAYIDANLVGFLHVLEG